MSNLDNTQYYPIWEQLARWQETTDGASEGRSAQSLLIEAPTGEAR